MLSTSGVIGLTWVSEDYEPVQVEFAWTRGADRCEVTVEECICCPELAARLIQMLCSGDDSIETPLALKGYAAY